MNLQQVSTKSTCYRVSSNRMKKTWACQILKRVQYAFQTAI